MTEMLTETQEQAAARIRAVKARAALEDAPDTIAHLREILEAGDGRTERGEVLPYLRTPLLTKVADDADRTYGLLAWWCDRWANALKVSPLVVNLRVYRDGLGFHGFPSDVSPLVARAVTRLHVDWLLKHHDEINRHSEGDWFNDEIASQIWAVRSTHKPTEQRPVTYAVERPCYYEHPGIDSKMLALFFGEPMRNAEARGEFDFQLATAEERRDPISRAGRQFLDAVEGITIECSYCQWTPIASKASKASVIAEWLA